MRTYTGKRWRELLFALAIMSVVPAIVHLHSPQPPSPASLPSVKPAAASMQSSSEGHETKESSILETQQTAAHKANLSVSPQQAQAEMPNLPSKIYYRNKVAVLTYHHLDPQESSVTITPERFESHLETLKTYGFHVISVEDFVDFLQKKKPVPPNAVVITFDDGYESVYKYAYPLLKKESMTATVFLIVSYIEDGTVRTPPILTWSEIEQMHKDGFSFYSHSYNSHASVFVKGKEMSELVVKMVNPSTGMPETDNEYKTRIGNDLKKADDILNAKLGNQINLLCLPHGQYNQEVVQQAQQVGIQFLFTGMEGFNSNEDKLIKRINAGSPYMTYKLLFRKLTS